MTESVLVRARSGWPVRVLMAGLLLGLVGFCAAMSVLVSHDSFLRCQAPSTCTHIEQYPFGVVRQARLPPVQRADVQWDTGGRVAALKLVLRHADGTRSEYQGVGKNGDRAEDVANELNALLTGGATERTFALRAGSLPVAIFLALVALAALVLLPYFFSRVRLVRTPDTVEVIVERWPARPRRHLLPLREVARVALKQAIVNDQPFFTLRLERTSGPEIDLGLAFGVRERAVAEQEAFARLLA